MRFYNASSFSRILRGSLGASIDDEEHKRINEFQSAIDEIEANDEEARGLRIALERASRVRDIEMLHEEISLSAEKCKNAESIFLTLQGSLRLTENDVLSLSNRTSAIEQQLVLLRRTLEYLPDAFDNIQKLQRICSSGAALIIQLSVQWEQRRRPLIEHMRSLKSTVAKVRRLLFCLAFFSLLSCYQTFFIRFFFIPAPSARGFLT
jgi:chromosome segregation ATPase